MIMGNGYARLGDVPAAERAYKQTFEDDVAGRNYYAAICQYCRLKRDRLPALPPLRAVPAVLPG
jgi:hypothetical protein